MPKTFEKNVYSFQIYLFFIKIIIKFYILTDIFVSIPIETKTKRFAIRSFIQNLMRISYNIDYYL